MVEIHDSGRMSSPLMPMIGAVAFGLFLVLLILGLLWYLCSAGQGVLFCDMWRQYPPWLLLGIIFLAPPGVLIWHWREQYRRRELFMHHDGQVTDRFISAVGHLGSPEIEVCVGGIFALERIAYESQEYHWIIMQTLMAFVRQQAPWPINFDSNNRLARQAALKWAEKEKKQDASTRWPTPDIQAALAVIGRRSDKWRQAEEVDYKGPVPRRLDLSGTNLANADLRDAQLAGVSLRGANLADADLARCDLRGADLGECVGLSVRQLKIAVYDEMTAVPQEVLTAMNGGHAENSTVDLDEFSMP